jgi:hypothetical protein
MTAPIAPPTDTPPEVAQAEAEAREADALLTALEERVRDGDDKVTPQQLAEQRELSGFAKLRAEAARRKADRAAAKAEDKRRADLIEQAVTLADGKGRRTPVAKAYEHAAAALAELVAAVDEHDQAVTEAGRLLRTAGCGPLYEDVSVQRDGMTFRESRPAAASRTAPRVDVNPGSVAFTYGDGNRNPVGAGRVLAALFTEAAAGEAGRMPLGEPSLTAAPLADHARRHHDSVRAFLTNASKEK